MKPRLALLFCGLLIELAWSPASAQIPLSAGGSTPPVYQTQPGTQPPPPRYSAPAGPAATLRLAYWNEVALSAVALDHTPAFPGEPVRVPEQLGPTRTSRVLAIVHIAIYDSLNAIARRYPGYSGNFAAFADSSPDAAIAQSAHDTLVALYPRQVRRIDALLEADLARLPASRAKLNGVDIGHRTATAILALRAGDGVYYREPVVGEDYFVSLKPGFWRPDPVSRERIALGAYWRRVKPFVIASPQQFRAPPPPELASPRYAAAFDEVRQLGGDGITTPTRRSMQQTVIGIFWAYDGSAWIGTVPRLFNQLAVQLALERSGDALALARALALVNVGIADAAIAVWDTKYAHDFWRPVTGIREASPGTSPTGSGDGNPQTQGDPDWTPLGSPASNLIGPNFTPPFPSYASGHAGLGGAAFHMLRRLYGDRIAFTFLSDEFNGITRDNRGRVRPRLPRSFTSLTQAEEESGQSRIYLGVHWPFDKTEGREMGHALADYIFARGLVRPEAQ